MHFMPNPFAANRRGVIVVLSLLICACSANRPVLTNEKYATFVLYARQVFDGRRLLTGSAVVVKNGRVDYVGKVESIETRNATVLDFGDSTILPGFIESHGHLTYKNVPEDVVLRHGITTLRDLGGPLHEIKGGKGRLRILTSGPILTAPSGYPISVLGAANIAVAVDSENKARQIVKSQISQGAKLIKIALETGGEFGAPWSAHAHHPDTDTKQTHAWPLLSIDIVKAIVDEAHKMGKTVSAHIGEMTGAQIALSAEVDEWAHVPCDPIPEALLERAARQGVTVISTIDTLSHCHGIRQNVKTLIRYGATIIYGAEIAHADIPWGIDAQELNYLHRDAGLDALEVLASATSKAAENLKRPDLGVIEKGAIADLIVVKGNPLTNFKRLEYPDFVMSEGVVVIDRYKQAVLTSTGQ